jgi:hypothetical protein
MKRLTVNQKLIDKINSIIGDVLSLSNLEELESYDRGKLFVSPPEEWSELEKVLCDYTSRVSIEIQNQIAELLKKGNSR